MTTLYATALLQPGNLFSYFGSAPVTIQAIMTTLGDPALTDQFNKTIRCDMDNLHEMVERLMTSVFPAAIRNHNILVNEIPAELSIDHNDEWVASIITGLLTIAATNTTGNFIRFTARKHAHMLVLEMQEFNRIPFNDDIRQLQKLAEKIGGSLSVSVQNPDKSLVLFSFPNAIIPA